MRAIELRDIKKAFKKGLKGCLEVLKGLSLEVDTGEIFGFLGPNGAGKTTTIKILMGLLFPSSGDVRILGKDVRDRGLKKRVGFLPEHPQFHSHLKAVEFLDLYAHLYGMNHGHHQKIEELLRMVGLWEDRELLLHRFSKGMVQRLGIAQAIMNDPEVIILDEPMAGLDPMGRRMVAEILEQIRQKGRTVFFSSHILPDVEDICDRVGVMHRGELKAIGELRSLISGRKGTLEELFIEVVEEAGG